MGSGYFPLFNLRRLFCYRLKNRGAERITGKATKRIFWIDMMTTRRSSWNMQDEKEFIDMLGTGMFYEAKINEVWPSRMQLLARYIKALEKRADEAEAELAEKDEVIKQKDAELEGVKKSAGDDEEEILKSLPESIRKRLEESEAAAKEAADSIAKMKEDADTKDAIAKAKSFGVGDADKVGPLLMRVAKGVTTQDDAAYLESMLKGVGEVAGKSALFKSIGTASAVEGEPEAQLQAKADEIRKENSKLTKEQAYAQAVEANPQLYTAYVAKRRG